MRTIVAYRLDNGFDCDLSTKNTYPELLFSLSFDENAMKLSKLFFKKQLTLPAREILKNYGQKLNLLAHKTGFKMGS